MRAIKKIVFKNLKLNKKRTFGTVLGIALSTMLICTVLLLFSSFYHIIMASNTKVFGYYHMHVGPLNQNEIATLQLNRDIKKLYPVSYAGMSEIETNEQKKKSYIILSMSEDVSKHLGYQLVAGKYPKKEDEILFSSSTMKDTPYKIGDTITININTSYLSTFYHEETSNYINKTYKIVGLADYGSGRPYALVGNAKEYTTMEAYIVLKNPRNYKKVLPQIEEQYCHSVCEKNDFVLQMESFDFENPNIKIIFGIASVVLFVIVLMSIFCIKNSFMISMTEKLKLYGMLRSIGATKRQLKKSVLLEGFLLAIVGIPIGIILGMLLIYLLFIGMNMIVGEYYFENMKYLEVYLSWMPILVATFLSMINIYFSSNGAIRKLKKIVPIEALKNSGEIKAKKMGVPKWIKKTMKIGGTIAYKNLKRSRKKYRATVISLVVCVFSFLLVNSLIEGALEKAHKRMNIKDYNVFVENVHLLNQEELKKLDNLKDIRTYYKAYHSSYLYHSSNKSDGHLEIYDLNKIVDNPFFSIIQDGECERDNENYVHCSSGHANLPIVALDDWTYQQYLKELSLNPHQMKKKGILIDLSSGCNPKEHSGDCQRDYTYEENDLIEGIYHGEKMSFEVGKVTSIIPSGVTTHERNSKLIVALSDYPDMKFELTSIGMDSKNPNQTYEAITNINEKLEVYNYAKMQKREYSFFYLLKLLLYCFLMVIAGIAIINIFNTITSNVHLRQNEFAILKSIGMTQKEFHQMIVLETIFYSVKSLLIGSFLGILGSYIVSHYILHEAFQIPYFSILISILFIFLFVFLVMHYSLSKINKQNIIETIRNENI